MAEEDRFADLVLSKVDSAEPFRPQVYCDPDGDCIEFLARNEPFHGERIDSLVTVYYGEESGEIVGSLIKGVRQFISRMEKKAPGFRIDIEDGRVRLEHIFSARLWCSEQIPEQQVVLTYRKLRDVAEEVHAEAELCEA